MTMRYEINQQGMRDLMRSQWVQGECMSAANRVMTAAQAHPLEGGSAKGREAYRRSFRTEQATVTMKKGGTRPGARVVNDYAREKFYGAHNHVLYSTVQALSKDR